MSNRNMFDKPNKDAFYIVTHFLLEKLNATRFHEAFRYQYILSMIAIHVKVCLVFIFKQLNYLFW